MTAAFGDKIKPKAQTKLVEQVSAVLLPGEKIRWVSTCNNFKPAANHLVVTTFRILGCGYGGVLVFEAGVEEDLSITPTHDKQTVEVKGASSEMKFKLVPKTDFPLLTAHLAEVQANADPAAIASHVLAPTTPARARPLPCAPRTASGAARL